MVHVLHWPAALSAWISSKSLSTEQVVSQFPRLVRGPFLSNGKRVSGSENGSLERWRLMNIPKSITIRSLRRDIDKQKATGSLEMGEKFNNNTTTIEKETKHFWNHILNYFNDLKNKTYLHRAIIGWMYCDRSESFKLENSYTYLTT